MRVQATSMIGVFEVIQLTRINGEIYWLNPELLESIEQHGDTVLNIQGGRRLIVCETAEEVVQRFLAYQREIRGLVVVRREEEAEMQERLAAAAAVAASAAASAGRVLS